MPSLLDVQRAAQAIAGKVVRTPLVRAHRIEDFLRLEARLFLKCENFQRTRSFKERGANNALLNLAPEARQQGVITRSSGNFAQALALAGQQMQIAVTVVMPVTAPAVKVAGAKRFGATVVQHGTTHPEGLAKVEELKKQSGAHYIAPYDQDDVMVGQGTAALEVYEDLPTLRSFFGPVGGGGLVGGCALALKGLNPKIEVVAVEPEGAGDFAESFRKQKRVVWNSVSSIADSLLASGVGELNWPVLQAHVDRVETISDTEIIRAMRLLFTEIGMLSEPSGAVPLAGLMAAQQRRALHGDVAVLVSGGNIDISRFLQLIVQG